MIYPQGKDQHKSCSADHGKPLSCPCLRTNYKRFVILMVIFYKKSEGEKQ